MHVDIGGKVRRIILKLILGLGGMDWIDLSRDRDQWRALVNPVMNLCVP
jgi:hypothetical protein